MNAMSKRPFPARILFLATLFATALIALVGCEDLLEPTMPTEPAVASVTVTPAAPGLEIGDTITLRAIVRSAAGDTLTRMISWSSADATKATVTSTGLVTALAAGPVAIRASAGGNVGQAMVAVAPQESPEPVILAMDPAEVPVGGPELTLTITGTGFAADARVQFNGHARPTTRISAGEVRATIWAGDVAQVGQATMQVVNPGAGSASGPAILRIIEQQNPVVRLEVRPALGYTPIGLGIIVKATPVLGSGNPANDRLVTWHSSNQLVATVHGNGLVTGVGEGEVVITARSEGREASSLITVTRGESYHMLIGDGTGLASIDLRLHTPPNRFWQHWPGSRLLNPSPSPDGRYVVYTIQDQTTQLAIMDKATRTYVVIPNTGVADQPSWSPNGDVIAFRRRIGERTFIQVVRPDGSELTNLTADLPAELSARTPAWAPDGSRIAFAVEGPGFQGLMTMKPDGSDRRTLTSGAVDSQPSWLGTIVMFTRRDPWSGATDIWRIDTSTFPYTPIMRLTTSGTAHSPVWSPDHRWVAYVEGANLGAGPVMAMRPFGEDKRLVSSGLTGGLSPAWVVQR